MQSAVRGGTQEILSASTTSVARVPSCKFGRDGRRATAPARIVAARAGARHAHTADMFDLSQRTTRYSTMSIIRRIFSRPSSALVDYPGSSQHRIARKRFESRSELQAHLYRFDNSKFIVSSVMSMPGSLIVETGDPTILSIDATNAELGHAVCSHLLTHEARQPPPLWDHRSTDWLPFKASGARSVSSFATTARA